MFILVLFEGSHHLLCVDDMDGVIRSQCGDGRLKLGVVVLFKLSEENSGHWEVTSAKRYGLLVSLSHFALKLARIYYIILSLNQKET